MAKNQRFSVSARSAALALLGRRDYTAAELRRKLLDKEYTAEDVDAALADLRTRKFIDDARVAAAHVRTATRVKGRGRVRIARELAARGIDRSIIEGLLRELEPDDEAGLIRKILSRKRWPAKPSMAERQKMFRHLLGRGFPVSAISKALGRVTDEE